MLTKASPASPKRYKGQIVTTPSKESPSSINTSKRHARTDVYHGNSVDNPSQYIPPTSHYPVLPSALHGVAEIHTNKPLYSPYASSIGSIGDVSDSQSCHSFSTAIDSDDGTILSRSCSSAASTPNKPRRFDSERSYFPEIATPPRHGTTALRLDEIESGDENNPQHYAVPWDQNALSPANKFSPNRLDFGKGEGFAYYDAEEEEGSNGGQSVLLPREVRSSANPAETVLVEDFRFQPTHLTIQQGSAVRFVSVSHASVHKLSCNSSINSSRNSPLPKTSPEKQESDSLTEFENRTLESNSHCSNDFIHVFNNLGTFVVVNEIFSFMSCEITVVVRAVQEESSAEINRQARLLELKNDRKKDSHVNDALYYLAHNNFDGYSDNNTQVRPSFSASPADKLHIYTTSDLNEKVSSDSDSSSFASSCSDEVANENISANIKTRIIPDDKERSHLYGQEVKHLKYSPEKTLAYGRNNMDGDDKVKEKELFYAHLEGRSQTSTDQTRRSVSSPVPGAINLLKPSDSRNTSPLGAQIPMLGSFVSSPGAVTAAIAAAGIKQLLSSDVSPKALVNHTSPPKVQQKTIAAGADFTEELGDSDSNSSDGDKEDGGHLINDLQEIEMKLLDLERARERTRILDAEAMPPPTQSVKKLIPKDPLGWNSSTRDKLPSTDEFNPTLSSEVIGSDDSIPLSDELETKDDGVVDGKNDGATKVLSEKALQRRRLKNQRKKKNARLRSQSQDVDDVSVSISGNGDENVEPVPQESKSEQMTNEINVEDTQQTLENVNHQTVPETDLTEPIVKSDDTSLTNPTSIPPEEVVFWEEYRPPLEEDFVLFKKKLSKREKKQQLQQQLKEEEEVRKKTDEVAKLLQKEQDETQTTELLLQEKERKDKELRRVAEQEKARIQRQEKQERLNKQKEQQVAQRQLKQKEKEEKLKLQREHKEKIRLEKETLKKEQELEQRKLQLLEQCEKEKMLQDQKRRDELLYLKQQEEQQQREKKEQEATEARRVQQEVIEAQAIAQKKQMADEELRKKNELKRVQVLKAEQKELSSSKQKVKEQKRQSKEKNVARGRSSSEPVAPANIVSAESATKCVHPPSATESSITKGFPVNEQKTDKTTRESRSRSIADSSPAIKSENRLMQLLHTAASSHTVTIGTDDRQIASPEIIETPKLSKSKSKRYQSYVDLPDEKEIEKDMELFFTQRMQGLSVLSNQQGKDSLPSGRQVPVVRLVRL